MRTVRDDDGRLLLVVKESGGSTLVRDPETGAEEFRPNDGLATVDDESALAVAAGAVPPAVRRILSATHDDRSLGLLVELVDREAVAVRELLADYDLCESDLLGLLTEFRAAGLVEEARIAGERGYAATELAADGVTALREDE
ncbi:DUF7346 family protein [Haloarchaeobius salinus]|uniref:DUF7346 family protein n=1 Tax=Haloarchaeobius salinus TaxID=1198298 RepID=UPI00210C52A5|nr:hypothetical protein [Haloarchaeobius salinus]